MCCWAANLSSYVEPSCGFVAKTTTTSSIQVSLWWCWIPLLVSNHHHNPCPYLFPCKSDQRHHSLLILPVYSSWIPQRVLLLFPLRVPSPIFSSDQNQIGLDRSSSSSTTLFWLCCITTLLSPFRPLEARSIQSCSNYKRDSAPRTIKWRLRMAAWERRHVKEAYMDELIPPSDPGVVSRNTLNPVDVQRTRLDDAVQWSIVVVILFYCVVACHFENKNNNTILILLSTDQMIFQVWTEEGVVWGSTNKCIQCSLSNAKDCKYRMATTSIDLFMRKWLVRYLYRANLQVKIA